VDLTLLVKRINDGEIPKWRVQQNLWTVKVLALFRWFLCLDYHLWVGQFLCAIYAMVTYGVTIPIASYIPLTVPIVILIFIALMTFLDAYVLYRQAIAEPQSQVDIARTCVQCISFFLVLLLAGVVVIITLSTPELQTTFVAVAVGEVESCVDHCTSTLDTECPMQCGADCGETDDLMCDSDCPAHRCITHCHAAHNSGSTFIEWTIVFSRMLSERLSGIQTTLNFWSS
jgi:hypothetical protein